MDAPGIFVVDSSAAIDLLVGDSEHHAMSVEVFRRLARADSRLAYNELLEAELLEAAFTWDIRRSGDGRWRQRRRSGDLHRFIERERGILREWRAVVDALDAVILPVRAVVDDAGLLMTHLGIGSYDAVHLATARRLSAPLLTNDRLLARAAAPWPGAIIARGEA
jgi:predicted nucleic acid-binding protein